RSRTRIGLLLLCNSQLIADAFEFSGQLLALAALECDLPFQFLLTFMQRRRVDLSLRQLVSQAACVYQQPGAAERQHCRQCERKSERKLEAAERRKQR